MNKSYLLPACLYFIPFYLLHLALPWFLKVCIGLFLKIYALLGFDLRTSPQTDEAPNYFSTLEVARHETAPYSPFTLWRYRIVLIWCRLEFCIPFAPVFTHNCAGIFIFFILIILTCLQDLNVVIKQTYNNNTTTTICITLITRRRKKYFTTFYKCKVWSKRLNRAKSSCLLKSIAENTGRQGTCSKKRPVRCSFKYKEKSCIERRSFESNREKEWNSIGFIFERWPSRFQGLARQKNRPLRSKHCLKMGNFWRLAWQMDNHNL